MSLNGHRGHAMICALCPLALHLGSARGHFGTTHCYRRSTSLNMPLDMTQYLRSSYADWQYSVLPDKLIDGNTHRPPKEANKLRKLALSLLVLVLATLCVVLATLLVRARATPLPTRGWSASESKVDGLLQSMKIVETTLGSDARYMSLSHEYDHLWEPDMHPSGTKIYVPTLRSDVGSGLGAIAMYADALPFSPPMIPPLIAIWLGSISSIAWLPSVGLCRRRARASPLA